MNAVLDQLGLNDSFFSQLVLFAVFFAIVSRVYFKPFLKLFEARHKKTVEDREAANKLMQQAQSRFDEYQRRLSEERLAARKNFDDLINQTKKEEAAIIAHAREEAKKITQDAAESVNSQKEQLKQQLEKDVEEIAKSISEKLLSRKV